MTKLRNKLIENSATIMRNGPDVTFQPTEVALPWDLFPEILRQIDELLRRIALAKAERIRGEVKATVGVCLDGNGRIEAGLRVHLTDLLWRRHEMIYPPKEFTIVRTLFQNLQTITGCYGPVGNLRPHSAKKEVKVGWMTRVRIGIGHACQK